MNRKNLLTSLFLLFSISFISCSKEDVVIESENSKAFKSSKRLSYGLDFKTKSSGNFSDTSIWQKNNGTEWVDAHDTPDKSNNVYLESYTSVILTENAECKNLNLNGNQDTIRINTTTKDLSVWGKMRTYTGIAPGTSSIGQSGSGIDGWITGTIKFKGSANRVIVEEFELSANSRSAGWNMVIAFDSGYVAKVNHTTRCGHLIVESGTLHIQGTTEGLSSNYEVRTAGDDYIAQPGNGVSGGTVLVKSGATLIGTRFRKNSPLSIGNSLASFTLESGATFIPKGGYASIATLAYDLSGKVVYQLNGNEDFLKHLGNVDAVPISVYGNLELSGSGAKKLVNNVSVTGNYSLISPATLNSNGYTLTNP